MNSAEIRARLATELRLDLIGPSHHDTALVNEILPDPPSRWYLTGFLVPVDTPSRRKARDAQEEMDTANTATELSDFSVCKHWGIAGNNLYLVDRVRRRMEYPD